MNLLQKTYHILVVSDSASFNQSIQSILPVSIYSVIQYANNISMAKRILLEQSFDFLVINAPLPDDFGTQLAIDVSLSKDIVALLLVRAEVHDEIYQKVYPYGVFTLSKPASKQMVIQALQWMVSTRERLHRMENKALSMKEKMEEIRIVNRAKWFLIDELKFTEHEAHRYIEKQAMDQCTTRRRIAEGIIKTYQ